MWIISSVVLLYVVTGGFKATPVSGWTFAHTIAQDRVHELNAGFSLNRFNTGNLIDEKGLGTKTWIS